MIPRERLGKIPRPPVVKSGIDAADRKRFPPRLLAELIRPPVKFCPPPPRFLNDRRKPPVAARQNAFQKADAGVVIIIMNGTIADVIL